MVDCASKASEALGGWLDAGLGELGETRPGNDDQLVLTTYTVHKMDRVTLVVIQPCNGLTMISDIESVRARHDGHADIAQLQIDMTLRIATKPSYRIVRQRSHRSRD